MTLDDLNPKNSIIDYIKGIFPALHNFKKKRRMWYYTDFWLSYQKIIPGQRYGEFKTMFSQLRQAESR
ncbi:MAG: hypothetical protein EWV75_20695 [Microcystis wesenbergii Mw_QC_S_20081001_S30D]|uniref:Uncharacterized protein n=1 Tax=Microcystis wesenbergii Mw_QC_S_20081001_S30D TaxID=2486245 RepID=A0A552J9B8_9CHRO|nr:hypothetical protein [Microcystis aeruginosa W11-03]NCR93228.1 hypothetical protein [Microcystis aeruginosa W11-06]TRU92370.1 MAG: hypothetical protein EWV75_20695 [Microcystis wesenbergii Mw_QC_S_20081001_S30D]TRU96980.1 MAG: hypothetical protein EWV73_17575 [Microcystis wesenbergii Mw_QC_B_20070930_S4D]TRV00165.1 MAG: hypothetical protein EWV74_12630 [Microcystis wesenbergii Mw_QC_S_20081001_S30]TRV10522.1 MAG: hypothetical protein EWV89_16865 [Microcystis wesenbergii Mw_QC_B_20070930_S4]